MKHLLLALVVALPFVVACRPVAVHADTTNCNGSSQIQVSTAVTTPVIAAQPFGTINICSWNLTAAGAQTAQWVYGSGLSCLTGQVSTGLPGLVTFTGTSSISMGQGSGVLFRVPAGNSLCLTSSAAVAIGGTVSYTVTPNSGFITGAFGTGFFANNAESFLRNERTGELSFDTYGTNMIVTYPELDGGNMHSYATAFNTQLGSFPLTIPVLMPFTYNAGVNAHDAAGGGPLGNGFSLFMAANQNNTTQCVSASGGPGSAQHCQQIDVGNTVGGGVANQDLSAAGSVHYMPLIPVSENLCGHAPFGGVVTCGGQEQFNCVGCGVISGAQVFSTFYPVFSGSTMTNLFTDTAAPLAAITQYDILTNTVTTASDSSEMIMTPAHDDSVAVIQMTADASSGASTIAITLPTLGTYANNTCTFTGGTGVAATDMAAFVAAFNGGSLTGTNCQAALTGVYKAVVANNVLDSCVGTVACAFVTELVGNPQALTATSSAVGSGYTMASVTTAGVFGGANLEAFQWGDNWRPLPDKTAQGWHWYTWWGNMNGQNDGPQPNQIEAKNYVLLCSTGPVAGVWTVFDVTCGADGQPSFQISPSLNPSTTPLKISTSYIGGGAGVSCVPSDCSGQITEYKDTTNTTTVPYFIKNVPAASLPANMSAFDFDWRQSTVFGASNGIASIPGLANSNIIINPVTGNLDFVDGCIDTNIHAQVCYLQVNTLTGATIRRSFVESGNANNNAISSLAMTDDPITGAIFVVVVTGEGSTWPGCGGVAGTCTMLYKSSDFGVTWGRTLLNHDTGSNTNGVVGNTRSDTNGRFIWIMKLPGNQAAGSGTPNLYLYFTQ